MSASFTAVYELARSRHCALCAARGCRVDIDADDRPAAGWLCHGCFESAPMRFKLTSAQDRFRAMVSAGCHPKLAMRRCQVDTRAEPLRDISADVAWLRRRIYEGDEP